MKICDNGVIREMTAEEHMIYSGRLYRCASDTAYSPADYAAAWVAV